MFQRTFLLLTITLFAVPAQASVTAITNRGQWLFLTGQHTFLGFTEYPEFTIITDQYAKDGIIFTDGNDFIFTTGSFPSDGAGLVGTDPLFGTIRMAFAEPRYAIGFDFIGTLEIELYSRGQLTFASDHYIAGFTPFVGFVSTEPFDAIVARDFLDGAISIDNLLFGAPVPAPAAGFLLVGLMLSNSRRRS